MSTPYPQTGSPWPTPFPLEIWGTTDKGRVREGNEDTVFPHSDADTYAYQPRPELLAQKGQLLLVADGIGGAQAGSEASRWVRRVVVERYYDHPDPNPAAALHAVIHQANASLYQYLQSTGIREAGSTIVAAVIHQNTLYVAHVGDSRAYLIRNGQAYRLTQDHTLTQLKLMRGLIPPEQAAVDPDQGVLTRSLGASPAVEVDVAQPVPLAPGDIVLLCSDGLTDVLSDEEIAHILNGQPPRKAARRLIAEANRRGGPDNITVAVARVGGKAAAAPKPAAKPARAAKAAPAKKGGLAFQPRQWLILGALAGAVLLVFALLTAALLLTRRGREGGGVSGPTPTPTAGLPATPATPTLEETAAPGVGRPTSTPAPTPTPTPTRRPPTATWTPSPTPTPTPPPPPSGEGGGEQSPGERPPQPPSPPTGTPTG